MFTRKDREKQLEPKPRKRTQASPPPGEQIGAPQRLGLWRRGGEG